MAEVTQVTSLILHELRVRRRTIVGWTIGLTFFAVLYMSFFPALPDDMHSGLLRGDWLS